MNDRQLEAAAEAVRSAIDVIAGVDLSCCDRAALDGVLAHWRTVRSFTDAYEVRIARRSRQLADEGRSEQAENVLRQGGLRSVREAQAAAEREQVCEAMPVFETSLSQGGVSTGHLDAVAAATGKLDDAGKAAFHEHAESLAADAEQQSVETFARQCRELARSVRDDDGVSEFENQRQQRRLSRRIDRRTGIYHFHLELDPESGSKVSSAYSAHLATVRARHRDDGMTHDQLAALAMVELITGARAVNARVPEVSVLIDLQTMLSGLHEHSLCETAEGVPIPPSTVRRLCCEAEILPAVLGGRGEVLDLGRSQRTANRAQRRALQAMYRSCAHPDCDVPFDHCQIHHVEWWERFGPTDLDNLIPLCSRHHHLVHEGGWTLVLHPQRIISLIRPDGCVCFKGCTIDRRPSATAADRRRRTAA